MLTSINRAFITLEKEDLQGVVRHAFATQPFIGPLLSECSVPVSDAFGSISHVVSGFPDIFLVLATKIEGGGIILGNSVDGYTQMDLAIEKFVTSRFCSIDIDESRPSQQLAIQHGRERVRYLYSNCHSTGEIDYLNIGEPQVPGDTPLVHRLVACGAFMGMEILKQYLDLLGTDLPDAYLQKPSVEAWVYRVDRTNRRTVRLGEEERKKFLSLDGYQNLKWPNLAPEKAIAEADRLFERIVASAKERTGKKTGWRIWGVPEEASLEFGNSVVTAKNVDASVDLTPDRLACLIQSTSRKEQLVISILAFILDEELVIARIEAGETQGGGRVLLKEEGSRVVQTVAQAHEDVGGSRQREASS